MKRSPGPRRAASSLSKSTHHRLNMYALAASAAGVGVLGLASPAEAKIVYTPAHVHFGNYYLDLNHDGVTDFVLFLQQACDSNRCTSIAEVYPGASKAIVGRSNWAAPLWPGEEIGSKRRLWHGFGVERVVKAYPTVNHTSTERFYGRWTNGGKGFHARYLGLKFLINGKLHYGWARVDTTAGPGGAVLTGYAYETVPGKAIIAGQIKWAAHNSREELSGTGVSLTNATPVKPQPAFLGMLALGAQGLPRWRRKKSGDAVPQTN
jgi:hypothetical protein